MPISQEGDKALSTENYYSAPALPPVRAGMIQYLRSQLGQER